MTVAHVTAEGVEFLEPQTVTQTHVFIDVTHLSLFGLLWKIYDYFKQINGDVVLFREPQSYKQRKLRVLLLPSYVSLDEVNMLSVSILSKKRRHI